MGQSGSPLPPGRSIVYLRWMQSEKTFFDDLARLMTGAAGAIGDAGKQLEARFREQMERLVARMDLATREEMDAVKAMAAAARDDNEQLSARVAELEAKVNPPAVPKKTPPRRKAASGARARSAGKKPKKGAARPNPRPPRR